MAGSVNKVILLGNLGQDPDSRSTPQGSSVCTLSVATSESYKDKATNEWKETTDWHRVVFWERLAETAQKYLKKGSKVYIEGKLITRSYEKNGETRYITEVRGRSLVLLDRRDSSSSDNVSGPTESYTADDNTEDDDEVPF